MIENVITSYSIHYTKLYELSTISKIEDSKSFVLGIIVGRLFNSFYYQSKKIFGREPTEIELDEFLELVKSKKSDFESLW